MRRTRERDERGNRAASERGARRRDPARREKRGREPRGNARASSDEEDWSEEETRDRRRRDERGARRGASSSSRDARPRENAARARRRVVAASPSASDVSSDEASEIRKLPTERESDGDGSRESESDSISRDAPERPRGLGRLWRVAGRGVIGGVLAARSALASTSRREARAPSRAGTDSDASSDGKAFEYSSDDAFETETGTETDSAEESEEASEPRRVDVTGRAGASRASSSSSDSDWDAETARSLRGDFYASARPPTSLSFAKKAQKRQKTKQSDAAKALQAALVRERLDAAVKKSARKEKQPPVGAERDPTTRKAVTFATSAAPETAPLLATSVSQTPRKPASLAGASLTRLVLLSAVALLGVVMLSAGASSVFAATLSDENARETRFAAEKRDARGTRRDSEARFAAGPEPETTPARFAGVRALDVSARGLDHARVADAEADAMVRAATAAAAKAKASRGIHEEDASDVASPEPEVASPEPEVVSPEPEVASPEPEVASPASIESPADDDDDSERRPHVTDDMTYDEKQAEFARFAKAEAERNDRIAAEAAERERADAAGEATGEETGAAEEAEEVEEDHQETEASASETTEGSEPTEEEAPLPEETDSSSWPLVDAGQDLDDDVTHEATAEMATLAMTPDQEARRAASVAGLGFDSRKARER
jgi:hypothetical protein